MRAILAQAGGRARRGAAAWLALLLIVLFLGSLLAGRVWLDPRTILVGGRRGLATMIVLDLRLPRAVLACLTGAALGLSGAVLQGLTRNPLAEPGLLGVSAGAALGAVLAIYTGLATLLPAAAPIAGLIGALAAGTLTFAIGRGGTVALILAGAAVSGLAAACIALTLDLAPNPYAAYEIMSWLMGSLADRGWGDVALCAPFIAAGAVLLTVTARGLDALTLGEWQAQSLGINLHRVRLLALGGTALAVGAATAETGAIGFIGLIAPHLARPLVGHQPSRVLLPAALLGAVLLLGADIVTRSWPAGQALNVGVVTSLAGTPLFFWLVLRLPRTSP